MESIERKKSRINPNILLTNLWWQGLILKNVQYEFNGFDELKNSSDIFAKAKRMWFYGGELFYRFYNNMEKNGFLPALIKSINNGGEMCAIFGPALYVENKEFLAVALSSKNVKLYKRHFRDRSHFKLLERKDNDVLLIRDDKHDADVTSNKRKSILYSKGYENEIRYQIEKFKIAKRESTQINRDNLFAEFHPGHNDIGELTGFITRPVESSPPRHASDGQIKELYDYLNRKVPLKKFTLEELKS